MYLLQLLAAAWLSLTWLSSCQGFGQFHMKRYQLQRGYNPDDSSENDNSVLRKTYIYIWRIYLSIDIHSIVLQAPTGAACGSNRSSCRVGSSC